MVKRRIVHHFEGHGSFVVFANDGKLEIFRERNSKFERHIQGVDFVVQVCKIREILAVGILHEHRQGPAIMQGRQLGVEAECPFRNIYQMFEIAGMFKIGKRWGETEPVAGAVVTREGEALANRGVSSFIQIISLGLVPRFDSRPGGTYVKFLGEGRETDIEAIEESLIITDFPIIPGRG